jgi:ketosteroid isomerase-like protein
MKKTLIILFASSILTGCNRSPVVDVRAEAEAIKKIEDQWTAAIIAKDINKIMGIFGPEAVVMNPNTPACVGLQSIRKSQELWFSDTTVFHDTFTSTVDTIEVSASGDLAYVIGHSHLNISTSGGIGIVDETDKWVTIYRKINGEWKSIVDIWNSDLLSVSEKLK